MGRFRLIETDDLDPMPKQKKSRKPITINIMDELDIDPEKEEEVFTISSDLYDYGNIQFKSMDVLLSYVSQKGFDCKIYRNSVPYGYWSSEEGVIVF